MRIIIRHALLALILMLAAGAAAAQDPWFETEGLNEGLPDLRGELDIATPQTAMETFLDAIEEEDFETAAQVLDLSDIDVDSQARVGPRLAEMLAVVLDRKVVISWQQLLERPDSLDANAPSKDPMAGQPRKSLLLGLLELDGRNVAIRLNRIKPGDEPAVWVFSKQTVGNIEPLFAAHGPTEFEAALPDWAKREGPGGLMWWEWIGLPLMVALAAASGAAAWRSFGYASERTGRSFLTSILRGLRLPATLAAVSLILHLATNRVFVVSGIVSSILEPLILLGFISAVMALAVNVIDAVLDRMTPEDVTDLSDPDAEDARSRVTTISAVRRLVLVAAVLFATGYVLIEANVFQVLGFSLLAGAGGLLFMLGFAAREVLGNILASLQIAMSRSARIGDQIVYDGHLCTVERIHFTFVQLHVWDDTRLIVPVLKFVSDEFVNRNLVDGGMTRVVKLKISNRTDLDALRESFRAYLAGRDAVEPKEDAAALVVDQDEVGITLRFEIPVPDPTDGWDEEVALREAMIKEVQRQEEERGDDLVPHLALSPNKAARNGRSDQREAEADEA